MINLTSNIAKNQYRGELTRQMIVLERSEARKIKPILGRCYLSSARLLEWGIEDVDHVVTNQTPRLRKVLNEHYQRVAVIFSDKVFRAMEEQKCMEPTEIKGMKEDFWRTLRGWTHVQVAEQVTRVNRTTRTTIKRVIEKGFTAGKGLREVAKDLRVIKNITNPYRATMIARTETHTAAIKSMNAAVGATRIEHEREWNSALDERTRRKPFDHIRANGERVSEGEKYHKTGEPMEYPGDPEGSAANVIHCRCVELYHTVRKLRPKPVPKPPKFVRGVRGHTEELIETEAGHEKIIKQDFLKAGIKISNKDVIETGESIRSWAGGGYRASRYLDFHSGATYEDMRRDTGQVFTHSAFEAFKRRKKLINKWQKIAPTAGKKGTVYRGFGTRHPKMYQQLRENDIFDLQGMASASSSEYEARNFMKGPNQILLEIQGGEGAGPSLSQFSNMPGEQEVLLSKEIRLEVLSRKLGGTLKSPYTRILCKIVK